MVTCYPVRGKQKSIDICAAFAHGCGGQLSYRHVPGPAMFYGVDESNLAIWRKVRASGDDWYYVDNSYFDPTRGTYFRITKNRLQCHWTDRPDDPDPARWEALDIKLQPWQANLDGRTIICPQSDSFMRDIAGYKGDWLKEVLTKLRMRDHAEDHIKVRHWDRNKQRAMASLPDDLRGAKMLLTYSSAAAVTAIISGIPAYSSGESAALHQLPFYDAERLRAMLVMANGQFTLDEMRSGFAWERVG